MPAVCPFRAPRDPACTLRSVHWRPRKTGPCFPLAVVTCGQHQTAFTLYPHGFAPYLRQPVLNQSPDGADVLTEARPSESDRLRAQFTDTVFGAAIDASEGRAWARRTTDVVPDLWWGTQGRRLHDAAEMLGVAPDLSDSVRDLIAETLSVDALVLREEARCLKVAPGYRRLGVAIVSVLGQVGRWVSRSLRLLHAGHLAGFWGRPLLWDQSRGGLISLSFPLPGRGPPS